MESIHLLMCHTWLARDVTNRLSGILKEDLWLYRCRLNAVLAGCRLCSHISNTFSVGSVPGNVAETTIGVVIITRRGSGDIAEAFVIVMVIPAHDVGATVTNSDVGAIVDNVGRGAGSLAGTTVVGMVIFSAIVLVLGSWCQC